MAIVRWVPFRDLVSTQDRINRILTDTFSRFFEDGEAAMRAWSPAVDVFETDQEIVLKAELPGINPKDVEARIENGTLFLKGQKKFENEVKEDDYHRIERTYGSFVRSFALPTSVDADRVKAEYKSGVLTLKIPKKEEAKPKPIKIVAGEN